MSTTNDAAVERVKFTRKKAMNHFKKADGLDYDTISDVIKQLTGNQIAVTPKKTKEL